MRPKYSLNITEKSSCSKVDYEEKCPLHFAAANGLGEAAKLLVDAKATVMVKVKILKNGYILFIVYTG